ncbi:hypothetical protein ACGC1H_006352 [Rhizoctonia solani]
MHTNNKTNSPSSAKTGSSTPESPDPLPEGDSISGEVSTTRSIEWLLRCTIGGARAIVPGALTASLACVLVQAAVNELAVQRIRYVAGTPTAAVLPLNQSVPLDSRLPATSSSTPQTAPITGVLHQPVEEKQAPKATLQRIVETLSYIVPLTKLDDKEYLERLERKRDALDEKIDRLSAELSGKRRP